MASPLPTSATGAGWNGNAHQQMLPSEPDHNGVQLRPMGLKVHYTFDKDSKVNCLARFPQTIHVQTIAIDEFNTIGVIDLRICVRAVSDCSPELAGQDCDYTIYAVDYSEPDTPLVGQGMLSWALDSLHRPDMPGQEPKLVTGRVTKNLLGVFNGGNRETLEVKLRLASSAKPQWQTDSFDMAMTPTGDAEWNSFIQANPQLGQPQHVSRVASPAMSQGPPPVVNRRDSFGPAAQQQINDVMRVAPIPIDPISAPPNNQGASSRPSSRASNRAPRKRKPTGRPRGRPRKKPAEGNTSGYEDGTEGEDGPSQKRIKTTKVEKSAPNPFAGGSESLRVAASTSGSLRNFRPVGTNNETAAGNHLQEVPRAPTPVPKGPIFPGRSAKLRRESTLGQQPMSYPSPNFVDPNNELSPGQEDGRSPESLGPTPAYSEDSPPDIGSSPPVQRTTPFLRSSPPPSSPVLPPMPPSKMPHDASFLSENMDLFGDEPFPPPQPERQAYPYPIAPPPRKADPKPSGSVPIQVFQMQEGPQGQDMVHICSYNSTYPNSTQQPVLQAHQTPPELPALKQNLSRKRPAGVAAKKTPVPSPPGMAPTPPPTTDAFEKPNTPVSEHPVAETVAERIAEPSAEPVPELIPEPVNETMAQLIVEPVVEVKEVRRIAPEPVAQPGLDNTQRPSSQPPRSTTPVQNPKRVLARSQSAGPLMLPNMPASEPAGPSGLSQTAMPDEEKSQFQLPNPRRGNSTGAMDLVPASDPPAPISSTQPSKLRLPEFTMPPSEPILPPPSSPPNSRCNNKNIVKKHAIKQRLEEAIMNGEMPPFCSNCGAIETPTWRKIWVQDREGVPEYTEYSEKPGRITAIDILQRDENDKPTQYRVVKKGLGPSDDKSSWKELLLCNPCGIWLTKCKTHRPRERWDKDASRIGQERRKRGTGRSKKSRAKADGVVNPTSEAYFHTDALGPPEASSPKYSSNGISNPLIEGQLVANQGSTSFGGDNGASLETQSIPGSTHSAASGTGTAKSPIDLDLDEAMGATKRILFPSPRKDGTPRVLGTVDVNIVVTDDTCRQNKGLAMEKENTPVVNQDGLLECEDPDALFRSPMIVRPTTPPNAKASTVAEPFKTPTRATPSHRPVTRSVSKSLRTVRSVSSPSQLALLQATPTRTPHSIRGGLGSLTVRRSPRNHQHSFDIPDTPISRTISQMLSEPNGFDLNSELDLSTLPIMDSSHDALLELGHLLSTDGIMPSSPPRNGSLSFDYEASWAQWNMDPPTQVDEE